MGKRALQVKRETKREIRAARLSVDERDALRLRARYEGSPHHKSNPGDFNLTPPSAPRPDKTLCDEAGIFRRELALRLFLAAIDFGLVSEATAQDGFPKQLWAVDEHGRVFEAMYGGSKVGSYHGYPIRRSDPLSQKVLRLWGTP